MAKFEPLKPPAQQEVAPAQAPENTPVVNQPQSVPVNQLPKAVSPQKQHGVGTFYQQGLAPVKAMQQALIVLARDIASHSLHSASDRRNARGDLLTGSNPFMNFLVTNYMNKAKMTGKQFVTVDEKQPTRMDTAKPNDNLKGVLNTIQRIGTPGKEQSADGNWGPRTNNALEQIYSFAHALISMQQDMGIATSGYGDSDLEELHNAIPKNIAATSINEKIQKADIIAKNLNKLRALYDNFRDKILDHPTYSAQIAQEKPIFVSKKEYKPQTKFTDYDRGLYQKYSGTKLDATLNGKPITVMPINLINMDNFKKFLNSKKDSLTPEELAAVNKNDKMTINKFLIEIASNLEKQ